MDATVILAEKDSAAMEADQQEQLKEQRRHRALPWWWWDSHGEYMCLSVCHV
jgi:hypothetical protein